MPKVYCGVCDRLRFISVKDYASGHHRLDWFCSVDCLYIYIMELPRLATVNVPTGILEGEARVIGPAENPVWSDKCKLTLRSRAELHVVEWLFDIGETFLYEPCTFTVPPDIAHGEGHYTPDVWLPYRDLWIEVKGVWSMGGKGKFERFLDARPDINIVLVPRHLISQFGR